MNRTIALFLTLAILFAHTLAIHKNSAGEFAPPYDQAHVAYRMAHNFVETGSFAWDPALPASESYPSLSWVGFSALAERAHLERLHLPVTTACQVLDAFATLLAVLVLASFSPGRLAGVIAPLLFVVSGAIAASAANGTEVAFFALTVIASFLAFERRWPVRLGIALALACATRSEGVLFGWALLALELVGRWRDPQRARLPLLRSFGPALAVTVTVSLVRHHLLGHFLSPWMAALFERDPERWRQGLNALRDFAIGSGWTVLLVFPTWYLLRGTLRGFGRRAFLLALSWAGVMALAGGGSMPYAQALVPMFALLLIAIQESMIIALDSKRRGFPQLTWGAFLLGLALSAVASKYPGELGPLPVDELHKAWMQPLAERSFGRQNLLGRLGLVEEIDVTDRLRAVGTFLRRQVDPRHTVLTPWPGAIGYLSRLEVIDALGRTTPSPGADSTRPWNGIPRVDVAPVLALAPDYIVPGITWKVAAPTLQEVADDWVQHLDRHPEEIERTAAVREALRDYELITVPIPAHNASRPSGPTLPFYLLRRKDLGLAPTLTLLRDGRRFRVEVAHHSHEQLVDLRVQVRDANGQTWSMRPTGSFAKDSNLLARSSILLFPTGTHAIELASGEIPPEIEAVELRAVLRNPGARGERSFATASEPAVAK